MMLHFISSLDRAENVLCVYNLKMRDNKEKTEKNDE